MVEAELGERPGQLTFEHDVGVGHESAERAGAVVGGEVEHDAALRRVVVPPPEAALGVVDVVGERPVGAAGVSARRLDDDHVGAEVAEHLARERGLVRGELDHLQPVERADRTLRQM